MSKLKPHKMDGTRKGETPKEITLDNISIDETDEGLLNFAKSTAKNTTRVETFADKLISNTTNPSAIDFVISDLEHDIKSDTYYRDLFNLNIERKTQKLNQLLEIRYGRR